MQLVKTDRDNLIRPLQTVSGIVERKLTLPILGNILMKREGSNVSFFSTDTEIQIRTSAEISEEGEDGAVTFAPRKLLDILRALPEKTSISLSVNDDKLTVTAGRSRYTLQTLPAADFPTVSQPAEYQASVTLPQKNLKKLMSSVYYAMSNQDMRYYLVGTLFQADGSTIRTVATDGHRLAYRQYKSDAKLQEMRVIIPKKTVMELQRLLDDSDEPVTVDLAGLNVRFTFGSIQLVAKLIEGKFPDYNRVIPKGYKNRFTLGRETLQKALQRAAIMTNDKLKVVRCTIEPESLKIFSTNQEMEEALEEIDIGNYGGSTFDISFNVTYLLDVLSNLNSADICIELGDANSSALITAPDDPDFKYVVMPMRI